MKRKIINPIIKDTVTFIRTSAESGGRVSDLELTLMPGGKNFPHYHKAFAETFTAMDGVLGVKVAGKRLLLHPGETLTVQPGQVHSFFNPGETEIRFNVKITPGHQGFEDSLRILYGLAEDGLTDKKSMPRSFTHIAVIGTMSDSFLPGVMRVLSPVLQWVAKKARENGTEMKLIEKYCR